MIILRKHIGKVLISETQQKYSIYSHQFSNEEQLLRLLNLFTKLFNSKVGATYTNIFTVPKE